MSDDVLRWFRTITALTTLFLIAALWQAVMLARELLVTARSTAWLAAFGLGALALVGVVALAVVSWTSAAPRLLAWLARVGRGLARLGRVNFILAALLSVIFPLLVLTPLPEPVGTLIDSGFWRVLIFWLVTLVGAAFIWAGAGMPSLRALAYAALLFAGVHRAAAFLPDISTYPFSLSWSEASRYFYASLFFSENVYGAHANPTVLHATRYMLQALPFLISGLPLWFHRAWQVFLWLATNAAAVWLVVRRVGRGGRGDPAPTMLWAFLFLFQGPIWYHLVVMVIIVLWGTDTRRFGKTLLVVIIASLWAGMSRINWIPFPAALAAALYLLEIPHGKLPLWKYLAPPFFWGLAGAAGGLASQWGYAALSGNALNQFSSSLTSDLLWYRLFPSATYPLGVIPAILLVTLPVGWLIAVRLRGCWGDVTPLRWIGLGGLLFVFFAGGLVVSAKIGGGSNLHNMDAYIAILLVVTAYIVSGKMAAEDRRETGRGNSAPTRMAWGLAIAIPVLFAIGTGAPNKLPDPADTAAAYAEITALIEQADGEVLFIAERHLLTFGDVSGVALVDEYEKVFLMEMAMSGNTPYLEQFAADVRAHRFALIVSEPVRAAVQDRDDQFGEENNAWDAAVSLPLLCFYEPLAAFDEVRVTLLVPKMTPGCSP